MNKQLKIFHTIENLHEKSGGPSRTVSQLTDALAKFNVVEVSLISQFLIGETLVESNEHLVKRFYGKSQFRKLLATGLPFYSALNHALCDRAPDIIHNHGLWLASNHFSCRFACKLQIPFVIHPRGMLEPWALQHRAIKKRFAMWAYQRKDLDFVSLFMATSESEAESIRRLGFKQAVAIIPNGVSFDCFPFESVKKFNEKKVVLFLSRVHPKKGLLNLIHAWAKLPVEGWELQIAGPNESGHLAEVLNLINKLGVEDSVRYIGLVKDCSKADIYRAASLFVLPTFSENFGVVVAEALSYGVPVITTRGAPWADLEIFRCGWWIDIGIEPLLKTLRTAMLLSDAERCLMGERGRKYVQKYNWYDIAKKTIDAYQWVLKKGAKPDCVHLG